MSRINSWLMFYSLWGTPIAVQREGRGSTSIWVWRFFKCIGCLLLATSDILLKPEKSEFFIKNLNWQKRHLTYLIYRRTPFFRLWIRRDIEAFMHNQINVMSCILLYNYTSAQIEDCHWSGVALTCSGNWQCLRKCGCKREYSGRYKCSKEGLPYVHFTMCMWWHLLLPIVTVS